MTKTKSIKSIKPMGLPILSIDELPNEIKLHYREFVRFLRLAKCKEARDQFRVVIQYYTQNQKEIPVEIELRYGQLLILEHREESEA